MTTTTAVDQERRDFLVWAMSKYERFAGLLDIVPKSGGTQKFKLNRIQRRFNRERTGRDISLKPRQVGFSTNELARDVYFFLTTKGVTVVIVCQSKDDGGPLNNLSKTVRLFFDSLRRMGIALDFSVEKAHEWHLASMNSTLKIVVAGGSEESAAKGGRSGAIHRLHVTEEAFFDYAEDTMNALLECVPAREFGSEIVIESTPNGAAGLFFQQCEDARLGRSSYKFHFYPWFEMDEYAVALDDGEEIVPQTDRERELVSRYGVTPEQLKWYRRKLIDDKSGDQDKMDQEYPSDPETCFLVSGRGYFDQSKMSAMRACAKPPIEMRLGGKVNIWRKPAWGDAFLLALDTSEGTGGNAGAGIMLDKKTAEHVATIHGQLTPFDLAQAAAELAREFNDAEIAPERNNHGHAVLVSLERAVKVEDRFGEEKTGYFNVYRHDDDKLGWNTTPITRPVMLSSLQDAVNSGLIRTPDASVQSQLRTFVVNKNGKPEAQHGCEDDLVLAYAIAWEVRQRVGSGGGAPSAGTSQDNMSRFGDFDGRGF